MWTVGIFLINGAVLLITMGSMGLLSWCCSDSVWGDGRSNKSPGSKQTSWEAITQSVLGWNWNKLNLFWCSPYHALHLKEKKRNVRQKRFSAWLCWSLIWYDLSIAVTGICKLSLMFTGGKIRRVYYFLRPWFQCMAIILYVSAAVIAAEYAKCGRE